MIWYLAISTLPEPLKHGILVQFGDCLLCQLFLVGKAYSLKFDLIYALELINQDDLRVKLVLFLLHY